MDPNFGLFDLVEGQVGNDVSFNIIKAIVLALSKNYIIDADATAPPGSPVDGGVYFIDGTGTGGWSGQSNKLVVYVGGTPYYLNCPNNFCTILGDAPGGGTNNKFYRYSTGTNTWTVMNLS